MVRKIATTLAVGLFAVGELASGATWRMVQPTPAKAVPSQPLRVAQKKPVPASRLVKPKPKVAKGTLPVPKPRQVQLSPTDPTPLSGSARESAPVVPAEVEPDPLLESEPEAIPALENDVEPGTIKRDPPDARYSEPNPADEEMTLDGDTIEVAPAEDLPSPSETTPALPETMVPEQPAPTAKAPAATGKIYRLEPPDQLVPVTREELKPGVIYLHDSPTLGRQVWSFLQSNGEFWHAFGPGTTQAVENFAFPMTEEESMELLRKIDPKLAFDVTSQGSRIYLRLDANNSWRLVRTNSVSSIYDLETRQRWEKQWGKYLPVVHIQGDDWEYREGTYQAPQWGEWMRPN